MINSVDVFQNPTQIVMDKDITVVAHYLVEQQMGTVIFNGTVGAQAAAGEVVTITITKPGGGTTTVTAPTLADKTFSASYTDVAGSYSAIASIPASSDANNIYSVATSPSVPFTIAKTLVTRTITLTVA